MEVLHLYRKLLRMASSRPPAVKHALKAHIREQFHSHKTLNPRNVDVIERLLRGATKQLDFFQSHPHITKFTRK